MIIEAIKLPGAVVCHGVHLIPVAQILVKDTSGSFPFQLEIINRLHAQVIEDPKSNPSIDQVVLMPGLPA